MSFPSSPMPNLAQHPFASDFFRAELAAAGIRAVPSTEPDGETHAQVDGLVSLPGGFRLRVVRRWLYASAWIDPPLPPDTAAALNGHPFNGRGTTYSGTAPRLGSFARAHGFAGGLDDAAVRRMGSLTHWHCDAVEALAELVVTLRTMLAQCGLTADEARRAHIVAHTTSWLAEVAPWLARGGPIADIARLNLHTNATLDAGHPRIVALRAQYPRAA